MVSLPSRGSCKSVLGAKRFDAAMVVDGWIVVIVSGLPLILGTSMARSGKPEVIFLGSTWSQDQSLLLAYSIPIGDKG